MKQSHELAGVEVLRFICAFAVLLYHYQHFLFSGAYIDTVADSTRNTFPMYALFLPAYEYGYRAVEVFWVISGFIFYRQYAELVNKGIVGFLDFAIRRFSRLYPLHFVTLRLVALGQYIYFMSHGETFIYSDNSGVAFTFQLFFASNWFRWEHHSFNEPIWSVSVEILIYFAFFGVVRTLGASAFVALLASGISWLIYKSHLAGIFLSPNVFLCGIYFFAGGAVQKLCKHRFALWIAGCIGVVTLVLLALHIYDLNLKSLLILAVSAVAFFSLLDETIAGSVMRRFSFLGNATYSSYLLHFPLQLFIVILLDGLGLSRSLLFHAIALFAYLAAVIAISLKVHGLFERPAQDWTRNGSKRWIKRAPQPS
jgi:peptidoglycan/LPS O-acetylase OafA/YrhL